LVKKRYEKNYSGHSGATFLLPDRKVLPSHFRDKFSSNKKAPPAEAVTTLWIHNIFQQIGRD